MPQQHNPGRHVQSLTLPQSRHNHRNTSAYIFPTAPTPRTTPPTPGHASPPGPNAPTPRRNAPAPFKTHPCRRTTAPHRPNPRTTPPTPGHASPPGTAPPLRRSPMLQLPVATRPPHSRHTPAAAQRFHRPDASDNPADTGTRHAPGTASPHRRDPTLQLPVATLPLHSRHTPAAAQRPHTVPTLGPPRRHRDPPRAGHKKIRLCEPDLFICQ